MGSVSFRKQIFPTQESNLGLLHYRQIIYQLSYQGSPKLEVAQSRQLFSPRNSLGQNTGVGSLSLLQGMFPTQGSNPGLSHCGQILYQPSHQGSASEDRSKTSLLESSTRLKPHEAQNYRKKALWVSWFSIIVTLALAVAAFRY